MRVLSLGAGVQSSTLLLMAVRGEIEIDRAIFADTQWEPQATYEWLGGLQIAAGHAGIPTDIVTGGNIREDATASRRIASMPLHVLTPAHTVRRKVAVDEVWTNDGWQSVYEEQVVTEGPTRGMLRRQCTKEYKVRPVHRRLRELGATSGHPITVLIGISWDEMHRMKDSLVKYAVHEYPLVERRMTRSDCIDWLEAHGYSAPPKSACIGCPFMDNARWREMRDNRPDEWAEAVELDRKIRNWTRIDGEAFLHRSLKPLPIVDLSTPLEAHRDRRAILGQHDLFEEVNDGECGAFTCMGGE